MSVIQHSRTTGYGGARLSSGGCQSPRSGVRDSAHDGAQGISWPMEMFSTVAVMAVTALSTFDKIHCLSTYKWWPFFRCKLYLSKVSLSRTAPI